MSASSAGGMAVLGRGKCLRTGLLFVLPALLLYAVFTVWPFIETFRLSFTHQGPTDPTWTFVGFENYRRILADGDRFWPAMGHAAFVALFCLTAQNALALLLAVLCDREIRGKGIYRAIFFIPPVTSIFVIGLIWRQVWSPRSFGLANQGLALLGLEPRAWLADPETALLCVAAVQSWQGFGYAFLLFSAGLASIPRDLYEAAFVDGATAWQTFVEVTLPLLAPVLVIVSILTILGTMQAFPIIIAMTGGGPAGATEVPVTLIYETYFQHHDPGLATAMAILLGVVLMAVSFAQLEFARRRRAT